MVADAITAQVRLFQGHVLTWLPTSSLCRYVLASEPDEYVFVYYRGQNDAWKGYGGAVVYTKAAKLPQQYVPALKAAAESVGLDWAK